jgi:cytochrome c oxidase subunit 4
MSSGTASAANHGDVEQHSHHVQPKVYFLVYGILMCLLILTVVMYYVDLSVATHWVGTNVVIALVIAVIKAALVVLFFMNVLYSSRLTWLWAGLGFVWLLLMSGIFMDYLTRAWTQPSGWNP